uniref:Uncharacterized protein n=1 Tax=Chromera velia CCMP2878 TaxID=1169474 RepID=A0A0G4HQP8_9ALVE|eukprot:Cvel_30216.t1-p1 / transcript=Cvel_30216.t1 / gene=Cvel_30216 / organism=Chromera_velia_CCMP2878 / gene_product=hypothetical protein / transcript_product=hypothetical protein / location=Cvel_scaffold4276:567-3245(+) / protein_length=761 / sequence_SO=supercontig / SO=protein_coding / is_pseudo=false
MKSFFSSIWPQEIEPPQNLFSSWELPKVTPSYSKGTIVKNLLSDEYLQMQLEATIDVLVDNLNEVREMAENKHEQSKSESGPPTTMGLLDGDSQALYRLLVIKWLLDQRRRLGRKAYFDSENEKARAERDNLRGAAVGWVLETRRELAAQGAQSFKRWHERFSRDPIHLVGNGLACDGYTLSGLEDESFLDDSEDFFDVEESESDGLTSLLDTDSLREATRDLDPFLPNVSRPSDNTTAPMPAAEEGTRAPAPLGTEDSDGTSAPPSRPAPAPPMQAPESECQSPKETRSASPSRPSHAPVAAIATEALPPGSSSPSKTCTPSVPSASQTGAPSTKLHGTADKDKRQKRPNFVVRMLLWLVGSCCCGGVKADEEQEDDRGTREPEEHLSSSPPPSLPPSERPNQVEPPLPSPPMSTSSAAAPSSEEKSLRTPAEEVTEKLQVEEIFASSFLLVENDEGILSVEEIDLSASEDSLKQDHSPPPSAKLQTPVVSPTEDSHNCSSPSHTEQSEETDVLSAFMDTPEGLEDVTQDLESFMPHASPSNHLTPFDSVSTQGHRGSPSVSREDVQKPPGATLAAAPTIASAPSRDPHLQEGKTPYPSTSPLERPSQPSFPPPRVCPSSPPFASSTDDRQKSTPRTPTQDHPQMLQAEDVFASPFVLLKRSDATAHAVEGQSPASKDTEMKKQSQLSPVLPTPGRERTQTASSSKAEASPSTNGGPDEAGQQKGCQWWKNFLETHPGVAKGINQTKSFFGMRRRCGGKK